MSRHVDAIKQWVFEEPDFDDETADEPVRRKKSKKITEKVDKSSVETIVFRDPAKRRKKTNVRRRSDHRLRTSFDLDTSGVDS